jgi:ABC-2 type transport system permease protein
MEVLFTSPVSRNALFFSRLIDVHFKASWMLIIFGIPLVVASGVFYHASLLFYGPALILLAAFSALSVNTGAALSLLISSVIHVRRMKKVLVSAGVIAGVVLVTLLRILRPERFVNPELFANLTLFITEIRAPSFILLPNRWLSESLVALAGKSPGSTALMFSGLLLLTAYVTTLFLLPIFRKYHYRGWAMLQEGDFIRAGKGPRAGKSAPPGKEPVIISAAQRVFSVFGTRNVTLMRKDFLSQIRDAGNVHQLLIVAFLIGIYLFSIASLPLNWVGYRVQLKYVISFFNLGLILIIIASLCSRLVYPAMVSEGISFWILKTSPLTSKRYIWTKFFFFLVPLFVVGQLLTVSSSLLIGIEKPLIMLKCITVAVVSFTLVGMTIAFGVSDLRNAMADSGKEGRSGSTVQMIASVFLILFTLVLEIIPVFLYFLKEVKQGAFNQKAWIIIGVVVLAVFLINLFVTGFSIRLSMKTIEKRQTF